MINQKNRVLKKKKKKIKIWKQKKLTQTFNKINVKIN
jgi:hypothetical protein